MFIHVYTVYGHGSARILNTDPKYGIFSLFFFRRTVAAAVTEEVFQQFRMYHEAGLPDFAFMRRVRSKGTHTLIPPWFTLS
jgi:hypothetical protein